MHKNPKEIQEIWDSQLTWGIRAFAVLGFLVFFASLSRAFYVGWQNIMYLQIGLYLVILGMAILNKYLSFLLKAWILVGTVFVLGVGGLVTWGLAGFGMFTLFAFCIVSTVLFGTRAGILSAVISIFVVCIIGFAVNQGFLTFRFDPFIYMHSLGAWATAVFTMVISGGLIVVALGTMNRKLSEMIATLSEEISDRKRAEELFGRSEAKYKLLLDTLPQKIFQKDENSVYLSCNQNFARALKITSEKIVGKTDYDLYPKEFADKYRADDKRIMASGLTEETEEKYHQNGREIWIRKVQMPVINDEGTISGTLTIFWEITERKKAQEKVKLLANAVQQISEGMALFTLDEHLLFSNNTFAATHGYSPHEIVGRHHSFFSPPDQLPSLEAIKRHLRETGNYSGEIYHMRRDSTVFPGHLNLSFIRDEGGNPIALAAILRDITEQKQNEQKLKMSNMSLNIEHNHRKVLSCRIIRLLENERQYIAMELHDHIGQILTSLKMDLELMENQQKQLDDVLKSLKNSALKKATQLIGDVRKIARGLSPLKLQRFGLARELNSLIDEVRERAEFEIDFRCYDLPQQLAEDKSLAIFRIVQEALNNVIKHAKAKQVFVNLMRKNDAISVSIEDDGIGFNQDLKTDYSEKNRNLGLVFMRERVVLLQGEFVVESKIGGGTQILAEIPI